MVRSDPSRRTRMRTNQNQKPSRRPGSISVWPSDWPLKGVVHTTGLFGKESNTKPPMIVSRRTETVPASRLHIVQATPLHPHPMVSKKSNPSLEGGGRMIYRRPVKVTLPRTCNLRSARL